MSERREALIIARPQYADADLLQLEALSCVPSDPAIGGVAVGALGAGSLFRQLACLPRDRG